MFRLHEAPGGDQHEQRDEERGHGIALRPACAGQQETDEDRSRARHVAREVDRVRGERRALVEARGPSRDRRPARVDGDDDEDDDERVPRRVDVRLGRADEHGQRAVRDVEAREHEDRGLAEGGQVLGLAVPVGMPLVGRPAGDPDREEREERGDEVGPGVNRLRDQPEAACREPSAELERDQRAGRGNRNESSTPLRAHARKATSERRRAALSSTVGWAGRIQASSLGRCALSRRKCGALWASPGPVGRDLVPAAAAKAAEQQAEDDQEQAEPEFHERAGR